MICILAIGCQPKKKSEDNSWLFFVLSPVGSTSTNTASSNYAVSTLAGLSGSSGTTDATGTSARFNSPNAITIDSGGNLYVADSFNHSIRKITSAGVVTTFAGLSGSSGTTDATGTAARFNRPYGITIDSGGNLYTVDSSQTIRKITSAGVVTTFAGTVNSSGTTDATGTAAKFNSPEGIGTDPAGNLYVVDSSNQTIRKVTSGAVVTTFAGGAGSSGSTDGTGTSARFYLPMSIVADANGNLYVTDRGNYTIRKITTAGVVTTFAGTAGETGSTDGTGAAARFSAPLGITIDSSGNLYVAEAAHRIRKITSAGVVTTIAGSGSSGSTDGSGSLASFYNPRGITIDSSGNLYVVDTGNHTIRKLEPPK
ncbi:hypothetical protein EHQ58_10425 [Leptospira ognonensis]|uniref:SMP-30/Gluconolactonase/LRE-like region domain-containing protein n=1 Tax=Leptospira ognonensis TaxID=2484945 RepID=A0A4R9K0L0_9LEPT|nr:NHL repeat-containing protein [Leptospira ognonensis]TGL58546.1 hypothetical protein EHQ58_10425 [Leptospira ognonensis]